MHSIYKSQVKAFAYILNNFLIAITKMPVRSTSEYNFIVSEEIAEIPVNLQLRRVSFEQLTKAVEIATGGNVVIEAVAGGGNLYHVRPGPERKPHAEPILRVFNLSKFLTQKSEEEAQKALEDVHQTVEIAFEMLANAQRAAGKRQRSRNKVDTKFHPGTKLMIVIGDPTDVDVFHEVISQLTGEPRRRPRTDFGSGMPGMNMGMDKDSMGAGGGASEYGGGLQYGFGGDLGGGGLGSRKQRR